MKIPTYDSMMNPLLKALHDLGGSGTNREIDSKVIEMLELPEGITEVPHGDTGSQSEVEYRLAWTKTYLKKYGLLENSGRGVWALVEVGGKPVRVEPQEVIKAVREKESKGACPGKKGGKKPVPVVDEEEQQVDGWKAELLDVLVALHPAQFERLTQRLLRECGFTQVEVTGKTGDGGIDGKGIIKIRGAAELSCHVSVQTVPWKRRARHGSRFSRRTAGESRQGTADHDGHVHAGGGSGSAEGWGAADRSDRWERVRGETQGAWAWAADGGG